MAKTRTTYICQNCGRRTAGFMGRCPACGEFNTMVEETVEISKGGKTERARPTLPSSQAQRLDKVTFESEPRINVPISEFNRVLGGGIVPGSITLIGGDPGIGKCVVGDTRLIDPITGEYLPITAWKNSLRPVLSADLTQLKVSPAETSHFFVQGTRSIIEVETHLGRKLRCTPSHPVLTQDGWKPAGELCPTDYIASPRVLPYFGDQAMPEAHVKLISYLLSDGSTTGAINITNTLPEVELEMHEIAEAFGLKLVIYPKKNNPAKQYRFTSSGQVRQQARNELATKLRKTQEEQGISWAEWGRKSDLSYSMIRMWVDKRSTPTKSEFSQLANAVGVTEAELGSALRDRAHSSTTIMDFVKQHGLRDLRAADKLVPNAVFTLPKHQLAIFLNRLFTCDGSIYVSKNGTPGLSYSTISRRLAEDVQHLLLRFGFITKLRTKTMRVNSQPYTAYELQMLGIAELKRFISEIGIFGRYAAKDAINAMPTPQRPSTGQDVIPLTNQFWDHVYQICGSNFAETSRRIGGKFKDRRRDRPVTRYLLQKVATAFPDSIFNSLAYGDIYWDRVVSLADAGIAEVFDISVPNLHNFVANDLCIHNSTLITQACAVLSTTAGRVLYVSGEESARQIKMRAERMAVQAEELYLLTETNLGDILEQVNRIDPMLLVIDSIQTIYTEESDSSPGSVTQVRECASRLQMLAKTTGMSVFLIGHVTKEGNIAGPRVLEHIVDTVLYLEGDPFQAYRLLRSVKNRFGATSEVGVFEMTGEGMTEVTNPSEIFLAERVMNAPGTSIVVAMEGTRPILVEIQALTSPTTFGNPRRTPNGVDYNRLLLVSAVLTRRMGLKLHEQDIFLNVIGGLKIDEPASDLAMAMALASSYFDKPLPVDMAFVGEIGLSGEVRGVAQLPARLNEAAKIGFKRVMIPKMRRKLPGLPPDLKVIEVRHVGEAMAHAIPRE